MSLADELATIAARAATYRQEDTLRQDFVEALNRFLATEAAARLGVRAVLNERVITGRPDARIRHIFFEVKLPHPRGPGIEAAKTQTSARFGEFRQAGISVRGIAYDGLSLALYDQDAQLIDEGTPADVAVTLESWLLTAAVKAATPDDVVDSIGSDSPLARDLVVAFYRIFTATRRSNAFVEEFFQVWRSLYGAAANLNREAMVGVQRTAVRHGIRVSGKNRIEEFLFAVETYLSVLLKLLLTLA